MKKLTGLSFLVAAVAVTLSFKAWAPETGADKASSYSSPNTVGLNLGNEAPEIALKDLSGNTVKLSSLRGKMVLIDFWASWCGPCRRENPAVVKAYQEFNGKKFKSGNGFTVFSVSLDLDPNAWKKAVERDGLVWASHVSELRGWESPVAATYGVNSIPTNFLINDKGIIINKNLRGEELISVLTKLVIKEK